MTASQMSFVAKHLVARRDAGNTGPPNHSNQIEDGLSLSQQDRDETKGRIFGRRPRADSGLIFHFHYVAHNTTQ